MALTRSEFIRDLWRVGLVRWATYIAGAIATYDGVSSQFDLPKLSKGIPILSKALEMTGSLLPWWGWLLVFQAIFVYALFEYVRAHISEPIPATLDPVPIPEGPKHVPPPPKEPEPDMALLEVIERVEEALSDQKVENAAAFKTKVNREIADKAAAGKLKVWARQGEFAIEQLSSKKMADARFDVFADEIRYVPPGYSTNTIVYHDIQCNSSDVDGIWPIKSPEPPVVGTPRPDFSQADRAEFDYPYPKAVLKADIPKLRGTRDGRADGKPVKCSVLMSIKNDHNSPLKDCSVFLVQMTERGLRGKVGKRILVGGDPTFTVHPHTAKNFHIVSRDMSDEITPAPFILKLEDESKVLEEDEQYLLLLELRSQYQYPTLVTVQIDTGEGLDVEAKIVKQTISDTPLEETRD